ncbi:glycosyltransferase [Motilibacter deserti]|uniref:glycosyltransferase n=1 Tax=Motilibacter deserti TaxID=2714956 RepID=UPI0018C8AA60|nr:glycosyltransferase [Motilibacter deserti]
MPGRPHVLYVVWGFPPCRAGGVYRALATANAFARGGWDVTVLTPEREAFERYTGVDPSLEERVDPSVRVERIPFSWPTLEPDVRQWPALRAYAPRLWARARKELDQVPFPEPAYGPWRRELEKAVDRLAAERRIDLCVATANPHVTFTAARRLHDKHGVPYVMDYRDAWSLDVFSGDRLHQPGSRVEKWERSLMTDAREVWFVNEPIRAWHAATYPETASKLRVVANGYDPEFAAEGTARVPSTEAGLTFGYVGTVSGKVPLAELVEGWRAARALDPVLERSRVEIHGYLGHYALPNPAMQRVVESGADVGVSYEGPVPKAAVRSVYERFDALLLVLGTGRYVTSGKVYEYLATGLPIVSVHDPGNAASEVLRGYPLWFPAASLSAADVGRALADAAAAAVAADPVIRSAGVEFAARYRRDRQLDPRVSELKAVAA